MTRPPDGWSYALDLSHWNTGVEYVAHYMSGARLAWVRAAYGTAADKAAAGHVRALWEVGYRVGLYLFWRSTQDDWEQLEVFRRQHEACGIGDEDLAPWLDVESDPGVAKLTAAWAPRADGVLKVLRQEYGNAYLYGPESELRTLGWLEHPTIVSKFPLDGRWRWPAVALDVPSSVDLQGHQFGVGVGDDMQGLQEPRAKGALDRSIIREPALRIVRGPELPGPPPVVPMSSFNVAGLAADAARKGIRRRKS